MNNQQAVVEQIIQNLAFEVEAVPKNTIRTTSFSQSKPLNVKIRVRKKDETHTLHEISSPSDETTRVPEKIRLVSSDQTIMTFDVFMEAEFEKQPSQKPRKHIFDILKPGICLGDTNDDDYSYVPSSSYSANITEPSVTTRSDGILKQNFTLSKNLYQDYTVSTQHGGQKWIFGKCKPGGCLDPPFSEDKYSYKPSTKASYEQFLPESNILVKEKLPDEGIECEAKGSKRPSKINDGDVKSNGRHSSIFEGGLFKKKRKSSDKSTNTKSVDNKQDENDSILRIYPVESANSLNTHSNSIITYPPKLSSDLGINEDKSVKSSKGSSEDKSRKSFNDHSEPCFIPPKGVNRIKENDTIYQKVNPKHRSNDSDPGNTTKDSIKMPIPIPIPIPFVTNQRNSEGTAESCDNTNTNKEFKIIADKDLQDSIYHKEAKTPEQKVWAELSSEDVGVNLIDSLEKITPDSIKIDSYKQHPAIFDSINLEIDDKTSREAILQPDKAVSNKNEETENPEEKNKAKLPILPIPIPINLDSHKPDHSDIAVTNIINKEKEPSHIKIKSEESYENIIIPQSIENKEDSIDVNQVIVTEKISENIDSESTPTVLPPSLNNSKLGIADQDSIPNKKNLQIDSGLQRQENDPIQSDKFSTKEPAEEEDITKLESNGQNLYEKSEELTNQIKGKCEDDETTFVDASPKDYLEHRSDGHMTPDTNTNEIKDSQNKIQRGSFQNKRPALNASTTSVASIGTDTKKNISANKLSNEDEQINADISHNVPENDSYNLNNNNSPINSDKENITETTKLQKNIQSTQDTIHSSYDDKDFDSNDGLKHPINASFITAPVIIDKIEQIPHFGPLKEVYSETNLLSEPKITDHNVGKADDKSKSQSPSRFQKYDDDNIIQSSHELIGVKSVIYDTDDYLPSSSSANNTEKNSSFDKEERKKETQALRPSNAVKGKADIISTSYKTSAEVKGSIDDDLRNKRLKNKTRSTSSVISHITSTNTVKSAMKKETISVELGFQSYLNDKNERILKTFDGSNEPKTRFPNDSVTVIKSQIRISSNEIRIPIDSDHDMSIQIKKPTGNQRVSISESGFVNMLDNSRKIKQKSSNQTNGHEISSSEAKGCDEIVEGGVMDDNVLDLYEHELVPLQLIIKSLRDEIDVLAAQQMLYRDKICCQKKTKLPRLVHSNKKCFGCLKK